MYNDDKNQNSFTSEPNESTTNTNYHISKLRIIIDWMFVCLVGAFSFMLLVLILVDHEYWKSALFWILFTTLLLPIKSILKIWSKLFRKHFLSFRCFLLIVMFFVGTSLLPEVDPTYMPDANEEAKENIEQEDAKAKIENTVTPAVEESPKMAPVATKKPTPSPIPTVTANPTSASTTIVTEIPPKASTTIVTKKSTQDPTPIVGENTKPTKIPVKKEKGKITPTPTAIRNDNKSSENDSLKYIKNCLGELGYKNFQAAAKEIGLNISDISGFKKIEDWSSGKRYSFVYKGTGFLLYMLDSNYVSGINCGLAHIYEDGYMPQKIDNYVLDLSILTKLQVDSEDKVKSQLNHPNTAKFHWLTSSEYECLNNIYYISANVDAKNSFGVKDTISFRTEYDVSSSPYKLVYLEMDGVPVKGKHIDPNNNRVKTDSKLVPEASHENSIILTEGQKGKYGKPLSSDPNIYLYYIPSGTYTVKCINKGMAFVSLPHDDENCDVYKFDKAGDTKTIIVPDGNIVQLMINTSLEFIPQ